MFEITTQYHTLELHLRCIEDLSSWKYQTSPAYAIMRLTSSSTLSYFVQAFFRTKVNKSSFLYLFMSFHSCGLCRHYRVPKALPTKDFWANLNLRDAPYLPLNCIAVIPYTLYMCNNRNDKIRIIEVKWRVRFFFF